MGQKLMGYSIHPTPPHHRHPKQKGHSIHELRYPKHREGLGTCARSFEFALPIVRRASHLYFPSPPFVVRRTVAQIAPTMGFETTPKVVALCGSYAKTTKA